MARSLVLYKSSNNLCGLCMCTRTQRKSVSSTGDTQEDWERENTCWRERGLEIREEPNHTMARSLVLYKSSNNICGLCMCTWTQRKLSRHCLLFTPTFKRPPETHTETYYSDNFSLSLPPVRKCIFFDLAIFFSRANWLIRLECTVQVHNSKRLFLKIKRRLVGGSRRWQMLGIDFSTWGWKFFLTFKFSRHLEKNILLFPFSPDEVVGNVLITSMPWNVQIQLTISH